MIGFIVSAVGLPILGVLAVSFAGGFEHLADRISPTFARVLSLLIMLTIGPCFAIPRTASTSYEMAVAPFAGSLPTWLTQLLYSAVFFALAFILAQHPEKLSKAFGKIMGPLLVALIVVLFIACLVILPSSFSAPMGNYEHGQIAQGFLDGYQTMDLLAALYFGIVISANARTMGIDNEHAVRWETALAGIGTGILLTVVYAALAFVGMVSGTMVSIDPANDTGATVLTNLTSRAFGLPGTALLGLVFVVACFNVCTGLLCTCSTYFHNMMPSVAGMRMSYRRWTAVMALFSFMISNAGLSTIITVSVPVLVALYPVAIVLVVLSLVHRPLTSHAPRIYVWTIGLVGAFGVIGLIDTITQTFGWTMPYLHDALAGVPGQSMQIAWMIPAAIGIVCGIIDSALRRTKA